MGFAGALLGYVLSTYISEILGTDNVGLVYLFSYAIVLFLLLNLHKIVRVFGKSFILQSSFVFKIIAVTGLLLMPFSSVGMWFLILYIISGTLSWTAIDGITESFSSDSESGRIRGSHLAIMNAGILMAPLLASQLLDKYGFQGIFLASFLTNSLLLVIAMLGIRRTNHKFKKNINVKKLIQKFSKRKNIMRIYYVSFALDFFYAVMVIYAPLYLLSRGFTWDQLGWVFTIMLVPFVLIQYPMGILADKRTGEREFLMFSFLILGISTIMFFISDSSSIMVWTMILVLGRIGAALAEILKESYFYKRIDGNDVDIIDFFKTSGPVAYIAATAISGIILTFLSINFIFLVLAIICFSAFYPTFRLVDNRSEKDVVIATKKA
jgi:MFS family permease